MYKVSYTKLAIMAEDEIGNISQGNNIAYMDCDIELIPPRLRDNLSDKKSIKRYHPIINNIEKIKGHIVI